jgi:hypothetical protein
MWNYKFEVVFFAILGQVFRVHYKERKKKKEGSLYSMIDYISAISSYSLLSTCMKASVLEWKGF